MQTEKIEQTAGPPPVQPVHTAAPAQDGPVRCEGLKSRSAFDRLLALVAVVLTQLIEHPALAIPITPRVTRPGLGQPFVFQFLAHVHSHRSPVFFS